MRTLPRNHWRRKREAIEGVNSAEVSHESRNSVVGLSEECRIECLQKAVEDKKIIKFYLLHSKILPCITLYGKPLSIKEEVIMITKKYGTLPSGQLSYQSYVRRG